MPWGLQGVGEARPAGVRSHAGGCPPAWGLAGPFSAGATEAGRPSWGSIHCGLLRAGSLRPSGPSCLPALGFQDVARLAPPEPHFSLCC